MREKIPVPQKLLLTVEEAAEYSHIGEKKIREMMNDIDCNFEKINCNDCHLHDYECSSCLFMKTESCPEFKGKRGNK